MTGEPAMTSELKTAGPAHIVVMGVTSCGKSTVGAAIADRLGAEFLDGDSLHPQSNIDKMASGIPLDDDDRAPWLAEIGRRFAASDSGLVIACSALKRSYRDIIRSGDSSVVFVHLHGTRELLQQPHGRASRDTSCRSRCWIRSWKPWKNSKPTKQVL